MKQRIILTIVALLAIVSSAMAQNSPLKGDVNGDGKVDVGDIVAILEIMKNGGKELQSIKWASTTAVNGTTGTTPSLGDITLTFNDGTTGTVAYNASGVTIYSDAAGNTPFSNANPGTVNVWAKFCGMTTTNSKQVTLSAPVAGTYYWYVGQTDPSTMTEISPIVDDLTSPGWRLTGNSLTATYNYDTTSNPISSNPSQNAIWYFALPENSGLGVFDAQNTNYAIGTPISTVTIGGIKYNIWNTGASRKFNAYTIKNK
jgi:hypothetical protein